MPAPLGNTNAAYPPEQREQLKNEYLEYLIAGNHGSYFPKCKLETVESYFVTDTEKELLEEAKRRNRGWWHDLFKDACEGLKPSANMTGIIFALKNKCGFKDKQDIEHSGNVSIAQQIIEARKNND